MAFAIIKTGGRQYRVAEGDTIDVDLLEAEAGKQVVLADVLMHADGEKVTHGAPIDGAKVTAEVVEQRKDKKVVAYKFRRRKGYHRTVGHRRKLTRLKIKSISVGGKKSAKKGSGIGLRMAHKKGQGSVKNGRDSVSKRLGVKKFGSEAGCRRQHYRPATRNKIFAGEKCRTWSRLHHFCIGRWECALRSRRAGE